MWVVGVGVGVGVGVVSVMGVMGVMGVVVWAVIVLVATVVAVALCVVFADVVGVAEKDLERGRAAGLEPAAVASFVQAPTSAATPTWVGEDGLAPASIKSSTIFSAGSMQSSMLVFAASFAV